MPSLLIINLSAVACLCGLTYLLTYCGRPIAQVSAGSPPCDELPAADDVPIKRRHQSMGLQPRDIFRLWFALTLVVTFLTIGLFTHIGAALHCVGLLAEGKS